MAVTMVLVGSVLGLVSGLTSLLVLDFGFLAALAIWSGTGILTLALALVFAMIPRSQPPHARQPKIA
jgi:amino acid transporter